MPLVIADGTTEQIGGSAANFSLISKRYLAVRDVGRPEILSSALARASPAGVRSTICTLRGCTQRSSLP
jgi:hypothetical protein